jgi:uncharacterized protein (TIGR03382 family)
MAIVVVACAAPLARGTVVLQTAINGNSVQAYLPEDLNSPVLQTTLAPLPAQNTVSGMSTAVSLQLGSPTAPAFNPLAWADVTLATSPPSNKGFVFGIRTSSDGTPLWTDFEQVAPAALLQTVHYVQPADRTFFLRSQLELLQPGLSLLGITATFQSSNSYDLFFFVQQASGATIDLSQPVARYAITQTTAVPEPGTFALAVIGLLTAALYRRRRATLG